MLFSTRFAWDFFSSHASRQKESFNFGTDLNSKEDGNKILLQGQIVFGTAVFITSGRVLKAQIRGEEISPAE